VEKTARPVGGLFRKGSLCLNSRERSRSFLGKKPLKKRHDLEVGASSAKGGSMSRKKVMGKAHEEQRVEGGTRCPSGRKRREEGVERTGSPPPNWKRQPFEGKESFFYGKENIAEKGAVPTPGEVSLIYRPRFFFLKNPKRKGRHFFFLHWSPFSLRGESLLKRDLL